MVLVPLPLTHPIQVGVGNTPLPHPKKKKREMERKERYSGKIERNIGKEHLGALNSYFLESHWNGMKFVILE